MIATIRAECRVSTLGTGARCIPVLPPHWSTHHKGSQKNFCNQPAEHFSPKILAHSARVVTHCREFPNGWWETFCRHPESIQYILDCVPIVAGHDCPLSEQLVLSTQAHLSRQFSEVSRDGDCNNQSRMPCFNFGDWGKVYSGPPAALVHSSQGITKEFLQPVCRALFAQNFCPLRQSGHSLEGIANSCSQTFCRHILDCVPIVAGHDCPVMTCLGTVGLEHSITPFTPVFRSISRF